MIRATTDGILFDELGLSLRDAIGAADPTLVVLSTGAGLPASGTVLVGSELIDYTASSALPVPPFGDSSPGFTLTGATRGARGTVAAAHPAGAPVGRFIPTGGRYSRRRGPAARITLTAAGALLLSVTRQYDAGELLIVYQARLLNNEAVPVSPTLRVRLDGADQLNADVRSDISNTGQAAGTLAGHHFLSVPAGEHTVALVGIAPVGQFIEAESNFAVLTVIQLPRWDGAQDLT